MSDKIESGIKAFNFFDEKLRDSISAFLVGFVLASVIIGAYAHFRVNNEIELKDSYKRQIDKAENEIEFLKIKVYQADEDCSKKVIFFNSMIQDLKTNTALTKAKTNELADKQKETIKQVSEIKDKVKQKVK